MTALVKCGSCGGEIEPGVPFRQCPRCLLDLGLSCENLPEADPGASGFGADWDLGPGLPDYEILERVGRGGMGIVYRARQRSLNRIVALKVLGGGDLASPAALARFRREAEAAAKLDHPNIVPIYEVGEYEANPFLVMKFIEGASLAERMNEFVLSGRREGSAGGAADARHREMEITRLVALVARSVHYAHGRGVLHRDVKPANILLDREDRPHLTDFGLARLLDAPPGLTVTSELLGTPAYMSPEQAASRPVSAASDIYSLGAVFYELLTGRRPFDAKQPAEVIQQVLQEEPIHPRTINPSIPRDLATICLKCLDKEPARRYASGLELAEDLERWQRCEPIRARPTSPILQLRRWARRNPAVAALILTLAGGLAMTLWLLARTHDEATRKAVALAILRTETARQLQEIWDSPRPFFTIRAETLAALAGREPARLETTQERFTIGLIPRGNPLDLALGTAPMLEDIGQRMGQRIGARACFDLRFYRTDEQAVADLGSGEVQFLEMNAREYVRAKRYVPGIRPLARPVPSLAGGSWGGGPAVIFTRAATGIRTLADLRGRSFLFATADSTLTFWAKVYLAEAGIHARDLARFRYLDGQEHFTVSAGATVPAGQLQELGNPFSEMTAVSAVLDGTYDAAVATERRFSQVAAQEKLVALKCFEDMGSVIVCQSNLSPRAAASFRQALLELKDPQVLQAFPGQPSQFEPCSDLDFADISTRLTAESLFDEGSGINKNFSDE